MHGSRRACVTAASVTALFLAVTLAACGASRPSRTAPTAWSSVDPPKAAPGVNGASSHAGGPSPAGASSATSAAPRSIPPAHPVPAAFQPAPGAPSDAEVRGQLEQLDALRREERRRALSAAAANLAGLLPWSLEPRSGVQASVASVFTDYGLGLACGGVLGRNQLGVAHKTAPCGTLITFVYGGRALTVPVIDRGPYIAGREWDLTGATAAALGFPGLAQIEWSVAR
jgi:rare lipoprotein A (peptidoglycan hydrolase)